MIQYLIPLFASYFSSGMATYWFYFVFALAFVATIPVLIRRFVR